MVLRIALYQKTKRPSNNRLCVVFLIFSNRTMERVGGGRGRIIFKCNQMSSGENKFLACSFLTPQFLSYVYDIVDSV